MRDSAAGVPYAAGEPNQLVNAVRPKAPLGASLEEVEGLHQLGELD